MYDTLEAMACHIESWPFSLHEEVIPGKERDMYGVITCLEILEMTTYVRRLQNLLRSSSDGGDVIRVSCQAS